MARLSFDLEWETAPGVRDRVLAATWGRLALGLDDHPLTELIDLRSQGRRTAVYGSMFPLACWLVENWWHVLHEPAPTGPRVPGGRLAPPSLRDWMRRHNLLGAREGGALPDLTIWRWGDEVALQWAADVDIETGRRVRFVGSGRGSTRPEAFADEAAAFIEAVLGRLRDRLESDEESTALEQAWQAIRCADEHESALCRSLATLGVDPYDAEEATDELVDTVRRLLQRLSGPLVEDLLESANARLLKAHLGWVERAQGQFGDTDVADPTPVIAPVQAPTPHEVGYQAARAVRAQLLEVAPGAPIDDLGAALTTRLGWARGEAVAVPVDAGLHLDGMVGASRDAGSPLLVVADRRRQQGERFRLARAAYFPVTRKLGGSPRLLSGAATPSQSEARAFAAELLAPAAGIREQVGDRVTAEDIERLADRFQVSPWVIGHQIENHDIGIVDA